MIDGNSLKYVITALTSKEKYKEAHALLDFFESHNKAAIQNLHQTLKGWQNLPHARRL